MKKAWIKKTKAKIENVLRYFAIYGAIPLVCGAMLGLVLFVQSAGGNRAGKFLSAVGKQSLAGVVGGEVSRKESKGGFYFLTEELLLPTHEEMVIVVGSGTYFSPDEKLPTLPSVQEEPESEEMKKPDVVYQSLPAGATPIISRDLSSKSFCINTTGHSIDLEAARSADFPSGTSWGNDPLVLVLHTHGTEGYFEDRTNLSEFAPDGIEAYFLPDETSFRTKDPQKSVVRVGEVFTETLISQGIPTLHVTTMHDLGDFNSAYTKSGETVKKMLKQYPSIQYVVDLHRDSVVRGDSYVKSYTTLESTPCAQVMLVVGTDKHDNWEKNLTVAANFKEEMDRSYPSLSRALYLRKARFNQQYLPGCLLLEVGSAANTLEEAENAARFAALSFSEMLKKVNSR